MMSLRGTALAMEEDWRLQIVVLVYSGMFCTAARLAQVPPLTHSMSQLHEELHKTKLSFVTCM